MLASCMNGWVGLFICVVPLPRKRHWRAFVKEGRGAFCDEFLLVFFCLFTYSFGEREKEGIISLQLST